MELINKNKISEIFVGRIEFLQDLQYKLDLIAGRKSGDKVYLLLNTPGIGKTKTIQYFGNNLMKNKPFLHTFDTKSETPICKQAIYIQVTIKNTHTIKEIYKLIIKETLTQFKNYFSLFPNILKQMWPDIDITKSNLINQFFLLSTIDELIRDPMELLDEVSNNIPIILHFDEFQETIHGDNKTIYNEIGIFLSGLLSSNIFCILSGTKFTIIRTIGSNRISPLNGKTVPIIIPYLSEVFQEEFASHIITLTEASDDIEKLILIYFTNWLKFYSGGHPRTMEYMTSIFITSISDLRITNNVSEMKKRLSKLFIAINQETIETLHGIFWKEKYKDFIEEETRDIPEELQQKIIQHIGKKLEMDRDLSTLIRSISQASHFSKFPKNQIEDFLSVLVQAGYLLINGNNRFYIPSRYAFQAFLQDWQHYLPNWYKTFQGFFKNPLVNEIMHHSAQSFGWTSEIYIKYGIMSSFGEFNKIFPSYYVKGCGHYKKQPIPEFEIPQSYSQMQGNVSVELLSTLQEKNYVVFSNEEAIDAIIKQDGMILALQITTNKSKDQLKKKLLKLIEFCAKLEQDARELELKLKILPWFISLEDFDVDNIVKDYNGLISTTSLWNLMAYPPLN